MLFTIHNMLAGVAGIEELEMEKAEAKGLAEAIANVAQHYDAVPGMSEKTAAWVTLAGAMGMAYAPRVVAFKLRMANEAREKNKTAPNVVRVA